MIRRRNAKVPILTDWVSFTPTGSWNSNVTYTGRWRRIGDTMEVRCKVTCSGAPNAANLTFNIPSGYSIDSNKIVSTDSDESSLLISGTILNNATISHLVSKVGYNSSTSVVPTVGIITVDATTAGNVSGYVYNVSITDTVPFTFGINDSVSIVYQVPILGWKATRSI